MPLRLIEGQYAPGDPMSVDLATDDLVSAQDFYGALFGWEFRDVDDHLWATKADRLAAGFGMLEALDLAGPRWWLLLAAPDLDDLVERASQAGGSVTGKMDLGGLGEAAVLEDPGGATAVLWRPKKLEPGALGATHGGLVWSELITHDPTGAAAFYETLFDLTAVPVEPTGSGGELSGAVNLERKELEVPRAVVGIVPATGAAKATQAGARWRPYFQVDDLEAFLDLALELGGDVADRRMSASRRETAVVVDPQGAEFGVVEGTASTQVMDEQT